MIGQENEAGRNEMRETVLRPGERRRLVVPVDFERSCFAIDGDVRRGNDVLGTHTRSLRALAHRTVVDEVDMGHVEQIVDHEIIRNVDVAGVLGRQEICTVVRLEIAEETVWNEIAVSVFAFAWPYPNESVLLVNGPRASTDERRHLRGL